MYLRSRGLRAYKSTHVGDLGGLAEPEDHTFRPKRLEFMEHIEEGASEKLPIRLDSAALGRAAPFVLMPPLRVLVVQRRAILECPLIVEATEFRYG